MNAKPVLSMFSRTIGFLLLASVTMPGCGGDGAPADHGPTAPSSDATVVCERPGTGVALIVSPALADGIRTGVTTLEQDLCAEGYTVVERVRTFGSAPDLRAALGQLHADTRLRLEGAILIGDHPHAYQWVTLRSSNPSIPSTSEEALSYQYYSDLDGTFQASSGYRSPAGRASSFDVHAGELDWEIWVSVLPLYRDDVASTVQALNRYFAKNHAYRTGARAIPRAFLEVSEHMNARTTAEHNAVLNLMRDGTFSWTPFSNAANARLYFNSVAGGLSVDQGHADLSAGMADFTVTDAHGFWGASGRLSTEWAESTPVRTVFYWSNGCAVGDLDQPRNFLTAMLYSPTSQVLLAKGTTNNSGGMGTNGNGFFGHNVATAMSRGASMGMAINEHVNVPLIAPWAESREFHFATSVTLGDGTLKLRP